MNASTTEVMNGGDSAAWAARPNILSMFDMRGWETGRIVSIAGFSVPGALCVISALSTGNRNVFIPAAFFFGIAVARWFTKYPLQVFKMLDAVSNNKPYLDLNRIPLDAFIDSPK